MGTLQTWLLYHNALSRGVEIEDILKYARKSKEKAGSETETIADLRSKLAAQEKKIQELVESRHHGSSSVIEPSERSVLRHGSAPPRGNAPSTGYGAMSSPGLSSISSSAVSDSLSAAAAAEAVRPSPGPTVQMVR